MTILDEIVANKRKEVEKAKENFPIDKSKLEKSDRDFLKALKGRHNIITEIKFKAPSTGEMKKRSIKEITEIYDKYASAISVITDKKYFRGELAFINEVRKFTKLPVLRKDFIIDEYQIYEARLYNADAILLIASLLSEFEIDKFITIAASLGMYCLVEVRTKEEIEKVLKTKAKIIGINNRNLKNFEVNIETTLNLKKLIPSDKLVVSESGIKSKDEIIRLDTNAVLIGTYLMKSDDIDEKLKGLHRTKVKVCGITNEEGAIAAVRVGVDILGFNFYKKSPRFIKFENAKQIIGKLPNTIQVVALFVNSNIEDVNEAAKDFDLVQLHGDENENFCNRVRGFVIKAYKVKSEVKTFQTYAKLFDTFDEKLNGGTGKIFDKKFIKDQKGKIFVAGGVTSENVNNIGDKYYAVDVCSGVEKKPGKKNMKLIKSLISRVKR